MDQTEILKLLQSVPTRVEAVKCAEGGSTKYQLPTTLHVRGIFVIETYFYYISVKFLPD